MKAAIDVAELAKTLATAKPEGVLDGCADEVVAAGQGDALLEYTLQLAAGATPEERVEATMTLAEQLVDGGCPRLGLLLMAKLYWVASELLLHHVCDGIELWMQNTRGREKASILSQLAIRSDAEARARYKLWS